MLTNPYFPLVNFTTRQIEKSIKSNIFVASKFQGNNDTKNKMVMANYLL